MLAVNRMLRWIAPIIALMLLMGSFGTTHAAPRSETTPPNSRLTQYYMLTKQQLSQVDTLLKRAEQRSSEIEKYIAYFKKAGKDTTALETALATYRTAIAGARSSWQQAADILKTHAGFDDQGKVTDTAQATATLKSAKNALEIAYKTMRSAETALNAAIRKIASKH